LSATLTQALRLVISGDSKGAVKALGDVADKADKTQGVFGKYGAGMNKAANWGAVGVAALSGAIAKSVVDYEAYGKSIRDLVRLTDVSTEGASTLVGEWKRFGVDATAGANGVKFFNKNLDAARQGSDKQVEAFERLGISMDDLKTLDDDELLFKTRDALAEMGPGADRTAIALALMGRGGTALMPWLNVAPGQMAEVNKQLEEAGLIWGDKELKQYADAAAAQKELGIAMTGISQTVARDVVPALTPFVRLIGSLLRFLRPLAPVIVPLTAALAVFVGVVKGAMVIQSTATAVKGFYAAFKLTKMATAITQIGNISNLLPGLTTGLAGSAAQWGLVGIAAAGAAYAILQAYNAAKQYNDMMQTVEGQEQTNLKMIDELIARWKTMGKDTTQLEQQRKSIIESAKVSTPWYYYLNPAYPVVDLAGGGKLFAKGGYVPARPGGTHAIIGEGGEGEYIIPESKMGKRGGINLTLHWSSLATPSRAEVRKVVLMLGEELHVAQGGLA
jgi:hypothetical protein